MAYVTAMTPTGETFHLKSFLADPAPPNGECEDFADFLVCLSTSVGASAMKSQRSNPLNSLGFWYRSLTPAHGVLQADWFRYHEFGLLTLAVWDGCIKFPTTGVPKGWDRDSTYYNRLVDHYVFPSTWTVTPISGFTPAVTTDP